MKYTQIIQTINSKINSIKKSQEELHQEVISMETLLNKSSDNMKTVNIRLKDLLSKKSSSDKPIPSAASNTSPDVDMNAQLEKLLQGSLDALGDKLSDKMLNMMSELKTLSGPMRTVKMREIKETADAELVDLSSLFAHQEVQSNIEDVGVDEQEVKGMDSSLDKLRAMRKKKK